MAHEEKIPEKLEELLKDREKTPGEQGSQYLEATRKNVKAAVKESNSLGNK